MVYRDASDTKKPQMSKGPPNRRVTEAFPVCMVENWHQWKLMARGWPDAKGQRVNFGLEINNQDFFDL